MTCKRLVGKVAVVTASTDGIGFAIARRLGEEGATVMISSRKQGNVDEAVKKLKSENLKVEGVVCHVGKAEDRTRLFQETVSKFGGMDIFVSNAAVSTHFGTTLSTPEASFDKMFDLNVKSTFMLCKEAAPIMEKRGRGSIVLVSSIAAYVPFQLIGIYSVTKTTLLGLAKSMAPELAAMNVRVNTVAPGLIETKFSSALTSSKEAIDHFLSSVAIKRIGLPEDISGATAFLASDDSSYMTGESIVVAGGATSRL